MRIVGSAWKKNQPPHTLCEAAETKGYYLDSAISKAIALITPGGLGDLAGAATAHSAVRARRATPRNT